MADRCDSLSPTARLLGAVNTISVRLNTAGKVVLHGENTDWVGIRKVLSKRLVASADSMSSCVVCILGAGGTASAALFALIDLGVTDIYVYNRTKSKALSLCRRLGGTAIESLQDLPKS